MVPARQGTKQKASVAGHNSGAVRDWTLAPKTLAIAGSDVLFYTIPNIRTADVTRENDELVSAFGHMVNLCPGFDIESMGSVSVFYSKKAEARYAQCKKRLNAAGRSTQERWVFHGTPREEFAHSIMATGFRVGGQNGHPINNGAVHGQGVYTDQSPATPTQYGSHVVLSLAVPGNEWKGPTDKAMHTKDYDSWQPDAAIFNGQLQKSWNVFKSADQLLPKYIIAMK